MSHIYIYIYDISSLRVNTSAHCSGRKQVKGEDAESKFSFAKVRRSIQCMVDSC